MAGGRGPQSCPPRAASPAPPPRAKTVFQLLREKRLREAQASKAAQRPVVLPPQLLVSSPVILQPPLVLAPHGAPAPGVSASTPSAASAPPGSEASGANTGTGPLALQALQALAPVSAVALQVPGSPQPDGVGQSQAPPEAPSPAQPLVQALGLPAPGTPLPASGVLTAPGLLPLPLPALVGLPRPAAAPDPQVLAVTLLPSLTETPVGQAPATRDAEPGPAPRADLEAPRPAPPPQLPAEAHGHTARPGQPPLPPGAGPGRTPLPPGVPLGLERPLPPPRGPEKDALDLSLLSQEREPAVQEWLRGPRGVCVPPLASRLPYQPPALCSLQALAGLLLHKKALEQRAAALARARERVRAQLRDSPAYLLLKARFLAAFTLPALLATLPPPGVRTTLAATRPASGSGSESEDPEELARPDGGGQPGPASGSAQAGAPAPAPEQVGGHGHRALPGVAGGGGGDASPWPLAVRRGRSL